MSTPDKPSTPPLTRRQLRELRNTGATPVVPQDAPEDVRQDVEPAPEPQRDAVAEEQPEAPENDERREAVAAEPEPEPESPASHAAPLPRAAEPPQITPSPRPDSHVDLGVAPLTRRQAREQERIRTASVPVVSSDLHAPDPAPPASEEQATAPRVDASSYPAAAAAGSATEGSVTVAEPETDEAQDASEPSPKVNPTLGAGVLTGESAKKAPTSFDELIARSSGGSSSIPNALILSQTPQGAPVSGPITSTGEVLVTGTFALPEGFGSRGHAEGVADGREVDAVLIDGELPPASSPTPIAASAAISTIKSADEIIRPPAPEKGNKLVVTLTIIAGLLGLAVVGVIVYSIASGVI